MKYYEEEKKIDWEFTKRKADFDNYENVIDFRLSDVKLED